MNNYSVEDIGERYRLFRTWKETKRCPLKNRDLQLLRKSEFGSYLLLLFIICLNVFWVFYGYWLFDGIFSVMPMDFNLSVIGFVGFMVIGSISSVLFLQFNSRTRRNRNSNNRVYDLNFGTFQVEGITYCVKYDTKNDNIVITNKLGDQYPFSYVLENKKRFIVYWGELKIGLTGGMLRQLERLDQ